MAKLHILPLPTLAPKMQRVLYSRKCLVAGLSASSLDSFDQICASSNRATIICNEFHFGKPFQKLTPAQQFEVLYKELLSAALEKKDVLLFAQGFFGSFLHDILQDDWIRDLHIDSDTTFDVTIDEAIVRNPKSLDEVEQALHPTIPLLVWKQKQSKEYDFCIQPGGTLLRCVQSLQVGYDQFMRGKVPATKRLIREGILLN